jgi:hypothetical protein
MEKGRIPKNSLKRVNFIQPKDVLQKWVEALYIVEPQRGKETKAKP